MFLSFILAAKTQLDKSFHVMFVCLFFHNQVEGLGKAQGMSSSQKNFPVLVILESLFLSYINVVIKLFFVLEITFISYASISQQHYSALTTFWFSFYYPFMVNIL